MIKTKLLLLFLLVPSILSAQVRRPPPPPCDCPEPGTIACEVAPDACAACWEECENAVGHGRRTRPAGPSFDPYLMNYQLPRTIAPFIVEYDTYQTTLELFDDLAYHGFSAATIWHRGIPFDGMGEFYWTTEYGEQLGPMGSDVQVNEDMYNVWTHPSIKTIMYRQNSPAWTIYSSDCASPYNELPVLTSPPYYDIALRLYEEFWWLDKTIVLVDWEQDHLLRQTTGNSCWVHGTLEERARWLKQLIEWRQLDVERARREAFYLLGHRPKLRVMTSAVINRWPGWHDEEGDFPYLAEIIAEMDHGPDILLVSYWQRGKDPRIMLDWLRETTGYPVTRIGIAELGEKLELQAERYRNYVPLLWDYGINFISAWTWKEPWCRDNPKLNRGLWVLDEPCSEPVTWDRPTDGYYVIMDLLGGNDE